MRDAKAALDEPVVLINAGDFTGGTVFSWLTLQGEATELKLMQQMGYDVAAIGNHEFDYSPDVLARCLAEAGYPEAHAKTALLGTNLLIPEKHPLAAAELKAVKFKNTPEQMMTLGELCALVAGRVPLLIEVKSHFDGDRRLVARMADVLASYRGPAVGMSFDPDQVLALRDLAPNLARGIVAERRYDAADWPEASPAQRHGMTGLRHAFRTRPHFVAYWVNELPAPAPWIARHVFGLPLLTWTVRTPEQRERAARYADQMIFEGFRP